MGTRHLYRIFTGLSFAAWFHLVWISFLLISLRESFVWKLVWVNSSKYAWFTLYLLDFMLNLLISEEGGMRRLPKLEGGHWQPEEGDDGEVPAREHQGEGLVLTDHGGCILWRHLGNAFLRTSQAHHEDVRRGVGGYLGGDGARWVPNRCSIVFIPSLIQEAIGKDSQDKDPSCTVKKVCDFHVPSRDVTNQIFSGRE